MTVTISADDTYAAATDELTVPCSARPVVFSPAEAARVASNIDAVDRTTTGSATPDSTPRAMLPPAPLRVRTSSSGAGGSVTAVLPRGAAGSTILGAVVLIRDAEGKVVARVTVDVDEGMRTFTVRVPRLARGYSADVYTVNDMGVSDGAPASSVLRHEQTVTGRDESGGPVMTGTRVGRDITFGVRSAVLSPTARRALDDMAAIVIAEGRPITVTGFAHGSRVGAESPMSNRRAQAVAEYLASRGVRLWIRHWGAGYLFSDEAAVDRRVEVRAP